MEFKVVIDTSVLISGLYSRKGAAFKLLEEMDHPDLNVYVCTSLNTADFKGSEKFGVKTITPKELLIQMGVIK